MNYNIVTIDQYRAFLKKQVLVKSSLPFRNDDSKFASEVMQVMMENSSKMILYCKNFAGSISCHSGFMEKFKSYVEDPKKEFKILVDDPSPQDTEVFNFCSTHSNKLQVMTPDQTFIKSIHSDRETYFSVADNRMYRDEISNSTHQAVCDFNDMDYCSYLLSMFEIGMDMSKPVFN